MRFALVDGERVEPKPGLKGACPNCQAELIPKCGTIRVKHWAHKGTLTCDPWWEKETEWHRAWKNNFPKEWQEISHIDKATGERHIADVKINSGLIIEFQHSHIKPEERQARERFYKNMVWIVDGTRLMNDFPRFLKGLNRYEATDRKGVFQVTCVEEYFPKNWLSCTAPVFFDFKQPPVANTPDMICDPLWCLLPPERGKRVLIAVSRGQFVEEASKGNLINALCLLNIAAKNYQLKIPNSYKQMVSKADPFFYGRRTNYRRRRRRF